jgi:hypothetical protein
MARNFQLHKLISVLTMLLIFTGVLSACHPEPVYPQDSRVLIINPAMDSTLDSGDIIVKAFVEQFDIVDKTSQQNSAGKGHLVFYMDTTPPMKQGESALSAEGTYAVSTETSYTWKNVGAGKHVFWVQLVNNDNTPIEPQAAVRINVTVK